jgi:biofilm PGA synthesis lipoprotein PgaB
MTRRQRGDVALAWVLGLAAAAALTFAAVESGAAPSGAAPVVDEADNDPIIAVLCYQEISSDPSAGHETVSPSLLRAHIRSLKDRGWEFATVSQLLRKRHHPEALPAQVAVLTFDGEQVSFYYEVLPILHEENVGATLALTTSRIGEAPELLSWEMVRQIKGGGLVEIASGTHALHRFEAGNPQGLATPAATTRLHLGRKGRYEKNGEYARRITRDLKRSREQIEDRLDTEVRVLAWPHGEYNRVTRGAAGEQGFQITLGLEGRVATSADLLRGHLPRIAVLRDTPVGAANLAWLVPDAKPVRAAEVDLDALYHPDATRLAANIEQTIQNLRQIGATHVFLQGCADSESSGSIGSTYFENRHAPTRADIWSMVAIQMRKAGLEVWIRTSSLDMPWLWAEYPEWRIVSEPGNALPQPSAGAHRISPEVQEARAAAREFFHDLAVHPVGKMMAIESFLQEMRETVRAWRPQCKFGRVVPTDVVQWNGAHPDFAQDFRVCVGNYDLTVVMAATPRGLTDTDVEILARQAMRPSVWSCVAAGSEAQLVLSLPTSSARGTDRVSNADLQNWVMTAQQAGVASFAVHPVGPGSSNLPHRLLIGDHGLTADRTVLPVPAR